MVQAYVVLNTGAKRQVWSGYSPLQATPGNGGVNVGTARVHNYGNI